MLPRDLLKGKKISIKTSATKQRILADQCNTQGILEVHANTQ